MLKRAVAKTALILGIAFLLWGLNQRFSTHAETVLWYSAVSELIVVMLLVSWVFIVTPAAAARTVYVVLLTGFFITFAAAFQDFLDELYDALLAGQLIEDIGYPMGIAAVTVGLGLWVFEHKRTCRELREQKRELEHMTVTDELTGLYNARHFSTSIEREIERCERYARKLSLLFIDIDNFKQFNDSYGHIEGNRVLQTCASIITGALRESDSSYRFGGEEFTIILPETGADAALQVAERIRTTFEAHPFRPDENATVHITLSGGIAELREKEDATTLVERADAAMYEAKMRGKNQIVLRRAGEQ